MHIDALSVLCVQLTHDLLAIAKFLSVLVKVFLFFSFYYSYLVISYSYFTISFEEALFGKQALRSLPGTFN